MVQTKNEIQTTKTYEEENECSMFGKLPCHTVIEDKNSGPKKLIHEILETLKDFEESVKLSHNTERLIFQNELQQQIDNHCLEVELAREKTKNERLKKLNESSVHNFHFINRDNQSEVRHIKNKCHDLTTLLKKRCHQLFKAREHIKDLKSENEKLQSIIKTENCKQKELIKDHCEQISQLTKELETVKMELEKERQSNTPSDLNAALRHQIKLNKKLAYNNCQLKSQISYSKSVDKLSVSTQKSSGDKLYKCSSDKELSG